MRIYIITEGVFKTLQVRMKRKKLIYVLFLHCFIVSVFFAHPLMAIDEKGGEISPMSIEGTPGFEKVRYAERTISCALEVDRDAARLIAFTRKIRPFVRSLKSTLQVPEPRAYEEGKDALFDVVLLGPGGMHYTRRINIAKLCLTHSADTPPHIMGDTIIVHRDSFIIELPEIKGFDRVEIAYYLPGAGVIEGAEGIERKVLAVEALDQSRFTLAGNSQSDDGMQSTLTTPGAVHWPEDYSDPDIYKVYGNEAETEKRINVVIVPDGYMYAEKSLMESHATSLVNYFRSKTPYAEHDPFINYHLVYAYSTESGTDQCDCSIVKDTAMSTRFPNDGYPCGDSGNRCLYYGGGCDTNTSSHIADAELRAPAQDTTIVMVNTPRYGGCGGARAVYSATSSSATEIAVHELGHSLGGLADEYTSYPYCGWSAGEINTSKNGTDGAWPEWIDEVGAPRQGAEYFERCIFRSQDNCDMRALNQPFCKVCSQHFSLVFFDHWRVEPTTPVESQSPVSPISVEINTPTTFSVQTRLGIGTNVTNSITWKLQGPGFPDPTIVASGVEDYERSFSEDGLYTMSCEVIADTNFIKPSKNGANVDTVSWDITVTLAKPSEVSPSASPQPLIFSADKEVLTWEEASASGSTTFNLYRGSASLLPGENYGTCFKSGIATNADADSASPPVGVCWTYIVTGETSGGEGSMGNNSSGAQRPNNNPCP